MEEAFYHHHHHHHYGYAIITIVIISLTRAQLERLKVKEANQAVEKIKAKKWNDKNEKKLSCFLWVFPYCLVTEKHYGLITSKALFLLVLIWAHCILEQCFLK